MKARLEMNEKMIKLSDFAKYYGVTSRAIQKHVSTLGAKIEPHIERRPPHGSIWLDDQAQEMIRNRMETPPPPVVADSNLTDENDRLKNTLLQLQARYIDLQNRLVQQTALASEAAASKKLLEAQRTTSTMLAAERDQALAERDQAVNMEKLERASSKSREEKLKAQIETNKSELEKEKEKNKELQNLLNDERTRRLTVRERFFGRKK